MWFSLIAVAVFNVAGASDGCLPLSEETATYEYYAYSGSRYVDGNPTEKDSSGRYPHGTHAKRFCKGSDEEAGLFVAICVKYRWVYYKDVKPCPDFRCQPLTPNETISNYQYLKETTNSGGESFEVVQPDADGKYPELTYIRRTCNEFPTDRKLQRDIAGLCYKAEWFLRTCPTPGNCYDDDIRTKLKYQGYSFDYETAEVTYSFGNDGAHYFIEGSQVTGICNGYQVPLWCQDGEWIGEVKNISCDMMNAQ
uniref:Transforming growth factor beta mimic 10 n=1 Tax=Heligmosomoides polygyrus bakeri TaxID=375939 RepID=A0A2P1IQ88_HELBE|nr:transforming growth factor beta mimic 10 [Heligmosomoides bakeri]